MSRVFRGNPIFEIIRSGDYARVKEYIGKGGNIDARTPAGQTAMNFAIELGQDKIANAFMRAGAEIEVDDTIPTPEVPEVDEAAIEARLAAIEKSRKSLVMQAGQGHANAALRRISEFDSHLNQLAGSIEGVDAEVIALGLGVTWKSMDVRNNLQSAQAVMAKREAERRGQLKRQAEEMQRRKAEMERIQMEAAAADAQAEVLSQQWSLFSTEIKDEEDELIEVTSQASCDFKEGDTLSVRHNFNFYSFPRLAKHSGKTGEATNVWQDERSCWWVTMHMPVIEEDINFPVDALVKTRTVAWNMGDWIGLPHPKTKELSKARIVKVRAGGRYYDCQFAEEVEVEARQRKRTMVPSQDIREYVPPAMPTKTITKQYDEGEKVEIYSTKSSQWIKGVIAEEGWGDGTYSVQIPSMQGKVVKMPVLRIRPTGKRAQQLRENPEVEQEEDEDAPPLKLFGEYGISDLESQGSNKVAYERQTNDYTVQDLDHRRAVIGTVNVGFAAPGATTGEVVFYAGEKVEIYSRKQKTWVPGLIKRAFDNGKYSIESSGRFAKLPADRIRKRLDAQGGLE